MNDQNQSQEGQAQSQQAPAEVINETSGAPVGDTIDLTKESNDDNAIIETISDTKFKLGQTLRDVVSGFEGLAIQKTESINGNIQFALQPKKKDDETGYPEAMFIDHHMLEFVDDGVSDRVTEAAESDIQLGEKVEDIATGFKGIAIEKATYMNGCVGFVVLPKLDKKNLLGGNARGSIIDQNRLQVIGEGIVSVYEKPVANAQGVVPGGPSRKVTCRSL